MIDLPKGAWAAIWSPEEGWTFLTPTLPSGEQVPPQALALTGAFIQLSRDEEFRDECSRYFMTMSKS